MRCQNCGNEIASTAQFCGRCGAPRPQLPPHFAEAETQLQALQARLQTGQIDRASFEAQRQALTVRGPDGSYWSPGGGGRWYWYDGTAWVERVPPTETRGAPRPQLPPHFVEAETQLQALQARLQTGQIDRASFEAQRQALTVRGPDGSHWSPGGGGRWYWYNGTAWVERVPPTEASGPPASSPTAREPKPQGKRRPWLWLGIGGAAMVCVFAAALVVVLRFGPTWFGQDVAPTPITASAAVTPAAASASEEPPIYVATFDEDAPTLFSGQAGPGGEVSIEGGRLCLQVSQADHTVVSSWESAPSNVSFDVDAAPVDGAPGTGYGVFVRGVDGNAGGALLFEINGQGQWRLRHKPSGGEYAEIQAWTDSPAIEGGGGANLLSVLVEGSLATFLLNGEEVASTDQAPTAGTVVGLVVSTPAGQTSGKACFDLFRASEIHDTPADDRQAVVAELGLPQAFDIAFGWDGNGVSVRYETWTYFDYLTDFCFIDGVLVESEALDPVDELLVAPMWYSPFVFAEDMTLEQVETLLGEGELAQVNVPSELGEDMAFYAGEQIVLGFVGDKLEYVETLALGAIEETD